MGSCCSLADKEDAAGNAAVGESEASSLKKLCEAFEKWPFLAISAVSLVFGFFWAPFAAVAVFFCGLPIVREAAEALFIRKKIKTSLLISCAMLSCLGIGHFFAAGEVAFLMAFGEMLEAATVKRAGKGLAKLVSLVPPAAHYVVTCPKCLAQGIRFKDLPLAEINVGDKVKVLPGETIPVDGVVEEGETTVDQSALTGESLPVDKAAGDEVYSGSINRYGAITVRVSKADADSSLQKLVRLVREAKTRKAPVQRIADKWAARLVPAALCTALLVALAAWAWSGDFQTGLVRGVTVMVVFCPCSLALATPTAIMAAIGQAAGRGVIVKSGEALEKMGCIDTACFDKTGTLTEGRLAVVETVASGDGSADAAGTLRIAAAVESLSEHPLAKAIAANAKARGMALPAVENFSMKPGRGVRGTVDGVDVACGSEAWLAENGATIPDGLIREANRRRKEGRAVVFVAAGGRAAGFVALSDTVRANAKKALEELAGAGVSACLLTGDNAATARRIAGELGIDDARADLLPEDKAKAVEEMQRAGRKVCMVGDGVNDAVALETALVGVAMGGAGSDIAVEAADIALSSDDIGKLAYLKRLSSACIKLIHFNIALSMSINAIAIACSAFGLLNPAAGAIVHNCGSLFVVVNAALLYDRRF